MDKLDELKKQQRLLNHRINAQQEQMNRLTNIVHEMMISLQLIDEEDIDRELH